MGSISIVGLQIVPRDQNITNMATTELIFLHIVNVITHRYMWKHIVHKLDYIKHIFLQTYMDGITSLGTFKFDQQQFHQRIKGWICKHFSSIEIMYHNDANYELYYQIGAHRTCEYQHINVNLNLGQSFDQNVLFLRRSALNTCLSKGAFSIWLQL